MDYIQALSTARPSEDISECLNFQKAHLEVGSSLLLDLVGQGVDLEAVEAGNKLVGRSLWPTKGTF